MSWVAVAIGGSAVIGGVSSYIAGDKAADAQIKGSNAAIDEQRRQYNTSLQMLEPQRYAGYQALDDISRMYGYGTSGYQTANSLLGMTGGVKGIGSASGSVPSFGRAIAGDLLGGPSAGQMAGPKYLANALGFGGRNDPQVSVRNGMIYFDGRKDGGTLYGGHINPLTGEVWVDTPKGGNRDAELSDLATAALREGRTMEGGPWGRFNLAYNQLARSGWKYNPEQVARDQGIPGRPAGQPGDMSRFFASPDYNFRLNEGIKALDQSAAARGGALSGNALRASQEYGSNLAAGEYGNYLNRLFNIAGMGQAATTQAIGAGQNSANNIGNLLQGIGNARASGIVSQYGGITDSLNSGLQNWMLYRGGYFNAPKGG